MNLPEKYKWLSRETGPVILREALKLYGVKETEGPVSTPEIISWAQEIGFKLLGIMYKDDSVAWCGLFMAVCVKRANHTLPSIPVRASSWAEWGHYSDTPMLGDVLVFTRQGGGHVGLYVGEDEEAYHVLGGNQKDSVCITRISKHRLSTSRRTPWRIGQPHNVRVIKLEKHGALSANEA